MTLASTQPLTKINTRNFPKGKGCRRLKLKTSSPSVIRLSRNCGSLDVSKPMGLRGLLQG
jgi:hypothetical protein